MTYSNLQNIEEKIRILACAGNSLQVTTQDILKKLDSFYSNDLPNDLKVLKLQDVYTINTIQNVDTYPFDFQNWTILKPPAYCEKIQIPLFQNRESFYTYNFNSQFLQTFDSGDGTTGPYSGQTQGTPITRSVNNNPMVSTPTASTQVFPAGYPPTFTTHNISRVQNILIGANTATGTLHVTDDGAGNLIGDCTTGTIDYQTGIISNLTFTENVPAGNPINIHYIQSVTGQPFTILYYQEQITLRPVPDQAYTVEIMGMRRPSSVLLGLTSYTTPDESGIPEMTDWWELCAFGVAKKYYQERLDMDGVQMMDIFLEEQIDKARSTTSAQLGKRQIDTIFKDETTTQNTGGWFGW